MASTHLLRLQGLLSDVSLASIVDYKRRKAIMHAVNRRSPTLDELINSLREIQAMFTQPTALEEMGGAKGGGGAAPSSPFDAFDSVWNPDKIEHLCTVRDCLHASSLYSCHNVGSERIQPMGFERAKNRSGKLDLSHEVAKNMLTCELDIKAAAEESVSAPEGHKLKDDLNVTTAVRPGEVGGQTVGSWPFLTVLIHSLYLILHSLSILFLPSLPLRFSHSPSRPASPSPSPPPLFPCLVPPL